jgi:ATP adenylyltransferase
MERLFSPWRSKYIESFSSPKHDNQECVFCSALASNDDEGRLIVHRGKYSFAVLNLFPYNSGHLMVIPNRHISDLVNLSDNESLEIMRTLQMLVKGLKDISQPDGFNIGSNLGRSAGAGIDQHLHFHLVPRWRGDTNFMSTLSDTKIISEEINETWKKLKISLEGNKDTTS